MIEQVLMYRCDFCPRMAQVPYPVALFADAVRPWPPDGWTVVGEKIACPAHRVEVRNSPTEGSA
jgi:hypothetical protein